MRFLITNDDGYDAPGLMALYRALKPLGEVTVVAPLTCHSSKGHAVGTKNALRVERRHVDPYGPIHIAHASPADCIRVGLKHVMQEKPDFVIAGINPGANLGVDMFYSGTAAAAREAALLGVPAIALSRLLSSDMPIDWQVLSRHVTRVAQTMMADEFRLPHGHFWNINFPAVSGEKYPEEITFAPQGIDGHAVRFEVLERDGDTEILSYSGIYRERGRSESCDVHHVFNDRLTATPMGPSLTSGLTDRLHSAVSLATAACAD